MSNVYQPQGESQRWNPIAQVIATVDFFHTPRGTAFARCPIGGHFEIFPVESSGFREWFVHECHVHKITVTNREFEEAVALFIARAKYDGSERDVFCRVARTDSARLVDLGNSARQIICVTAQSWELVPQKDGVAFIRPPGMLSLPEPISSPDSGKRLQDLLRLDDDQFRIVLVWLLLCLDSSGPHPMLRFIGEDSSFLAKALRVLIDPNAVSTRGAPRNEVDCMIAATNTYVIALEISKMTERLADWLRYLYAGVGVGTRWLYRANEELVWAGQHPVILASDEEIAVEGAIREISLAVVLAPFGPRERKSEGERLAALERIRPAFFGYLLDVLTCVLSLESLTPPTLPRLTEFAALGARAEAVLWPKGAFASAYARARLADSPATAHVLRFGFEMGKWTGRATELLQAINQRASTAERFTPLWPRDAAALGKELRTTASLIRELGLSIDFWRSPGDDRRRAIILRVEK